MSSLTMKVSSTHPYEKTVEVVREQLAEAGFGVLTEIDLKATLKKKLDVDIEPQIILGACRPQLAHLALQADPSIAALLPCNVVVRSEDGHTVVEAFDPQVMTTMSTDASPELLEVAADARRRLVVALEAVRVA